MNRYTMTMNVPIVAASDEEAGEIAMLLAAVAAGFSCTPAGEKTQVGMRLTRRPKPGSSLPMAVEVPLPRRGQDD